MQIKSIISCQYISKGVKLEIWIILSVGKSMEQLWIYVSRVTVNWSNHVEKKCFKVLNKFQHTHNLETLSHICPAEISVHVYHNVQDHS